MKLNINEKDIKLVAMCVFIEEIFEIDHEDYLSEEQAKRVDIMLDTFQPFADDTEANEELKSFVINMLKEL